uniref:Uncharacterized protein n=1 Tax=Opuntia streptacantha TaxID=393608 RepID=A0A7C9DLV5_OPUST
MLCYLDSLFCPEYLCLTLTLGQGHRHFTLHFRPENAQDLKLLRLTLTHLSDTRHSDMAMAESNFSLHVLRCMPGNQGYKPIYLSSIMLQIPIYLKLLVPTVTQTH